MTISLRIRSHGPHRIIDCSLQGFPQDKIIAGCSVFIAGHMAISGLIFSIL